MSSWVTVEFGLAAGGGEFLGDWNLGWLQVGVSSWVTVEFGLAAGGGEFLGDCGIWAGCRWG